MSSTETTAQASARSDASPASQTTFEPKAINWGEYDVEERIKTTLHSHRHADILYYLYTHERQTQAEIAEKLGVCPDTISRHMAANGVETSPRGAGTYRDPANDGSGCSPNQHPRYRAYVDGKQVWTYLHHLLAIADGADPHLVFGTEGPSGQWVVHHRLPTAATINVPENVEAMPRSVHRQLTHPSRAETPEAADTASDPAEVLDRWADETPTDGDE